MTYIRGLAMMPGNVPLWRPMNIFIHHQHGRKIRIKNESTTSASVELTQTRHSHSKQLLHGGHISVFLQGGSKASYAACKVLFLAVAEI